MLSLLDIMDASERYQERLHRAEQERLNNADLHETRLALRTRLYTWLGQVTKRHSRDVHTIAPRHRMA